MSKGMHDFQNILVLDSAGAGCSVGVLAAGQRFVISERMAGGQAERLMPMVEAVIRDAGLSYSDIDAIVTTVGPGAFTGIRIGVSAAKGLGLALDRPVYGLSSLQALALQFVTEKKPENGVAVILETKRADLYFQQFTASGLALSEPVALMASEMVKKINQDFFIVGDAIDRFCKETGLYGERCVKGFDQVDAGFVASDFQCSFNSQRYFTPPNPLYLSGAHITQSKKTVRPAISA